MAHHPTIRAFLAVDIPRVVGLSAVVQDLKSSGNKIKFVSEDQCHITLKFLGNISVLDIEKVKGFMATAVEGISPFEIILRGMGVFPDIKRPRVIWIGVVDEHHGLKRIAQRLDALVKEIGIPREKRPFTPHLTIGRIKFARNPAAILRVINAEKTKDFGIVTVDVIKLKKSTLTPNGPIYEDIHTEKLK